MVRKFCPLVGSLFSKFSLSSAGPIMMKRLIGSLPGQVSRASTFLITISALLILLAGGCSEDGILIEVTTANAPPATSRLAVTAKRDAQMAIDPRFVQQDLSRFDVKLAASAGDLVTLTLVAEDGTGCSLATGQVQVQITDERRYQVATQLALPAEPSCMLVVDKVGAGDARIISDVLGKDGQPAVDCPGKCSALFSKDQTVTLSGVTIAPWYFGGWAGDCSGRSNCTIKVSPTGSKHVIYNAIYPPVCTRDNWCWENPRPSEQVIYSSSLSNNSYSLSYAAGSTGLLMLLQNNNVWTTYPRFTTETITAIYGAGYSTACDRDLAVTAVGSVYDCSDSQWTKIFQVMAKTPLRGGYRNAAPPYKSIVVGDAGTILSCDYITGPCKTVPSGTSNNLRAISSGYWVVGDRGTLLKVDSASLAITPILTGLSDNLQAITDTWIVGANGAMLRYQGGTWQSAPRVTSQNLNSVTKGLTINGITEYWAAGDRGTILHWTGAAWQSTPTGVANNILTIAANQASSAANNKVWAMGDSGLFLQWDGQQWIRTQNDGYAPITGVNLTSVWGSGVNDVWATGNYGGYVVHWDGIRWSKLAVPANPSDCCVAVWASSPQDVWLIGDHGTVLRWNGTKWNDMKYPGSGTQLKAIWGADSSNVFVAGEVSKIQRWDGTRWQPDSDFETFGNVSIFGSSLDNMWLTSANSLYHRVGSDWVLESAGALIEPWSGWSFGPESVWVDGKSGFIRRIRDPISWKPAWDIIILGPASRRLGIWGSSATDVWVAGELNGLGRWGGNALIPLDGGASGNLWALWGAGPDDVWVVGDSGTILRYRPY